jgi:glycosyltransferase involved in cell wall biosynthesis
MKSVAICITNYNSGETIQLCIESIRRFTQYPHKIIVCDDVTDPEFYDDLTYLRQVRDKGWITLLENTARMGHGSTLARILDSCVADGIDLAMILDCDIQVIKDGWLEKMIAHQETTGAAMITDLEEFPDNIAIASWFFMLDLVQYPSVRADWGYTQKGPKDQYSHLKYAYGSGMYPTGYQIYKRIVDQGRIIAPFPAGISSFPVGPEAYYKHHVHISVLSLPQSGPCWVIRQQRYAIIQSELRKLRAGT